GSSTDQAPAGGAAVVHPQAVVPAHVPAAPVPFLYSLASLQDIGPQEGSFVPHEQRPAADLSRRSFLGRYND
ncbi:unnamed protein product, partial [Amoebophrya sp. A120]